MSYYDHPGYPEPHSPQTDHTLTRPDPTPLTRVEFLKGRVSSLAQQGWEALSGGIPPEIARKFWFFADKLAPEEYRQLANENLFVRNVGDTLMELGHIWREENIGYPYYRLYKDLEGLC